MHVDQVFTNCRLATMDPGRPGLGVIDDGVLAEVGGRIAWVGPRAEAPAFGTARTRHCGGRWITPGLIDCHTHLVFAGDRSDEFERRLAGESYADIARSGGGIRSTVRATRAASHAVLADLASERIRTLVEDGVTTVEVKSGYGLDLATELRLLEVARNCQAYGARVVTTCLAAHSVPPDMERGRYLDLVCDEIVPRVAAEGLADAVDAFMETVAFTAEEVARVFEAAKAHGLRVKLHADQLSDGGGAALAARFSALSADHLEYTSEEGATAMGRAGTVAVLLPGAFLMLRETQKPPVEAFRRHGVPMAVATDLNPGSSPVHSLRVAATLACVQFGLTVAEALLGMTRNAARALGCDDLGVLAPGKQCDLAVWGVDNLAELIAKIGPAPLDGGMRGGALWWRQRRL
jgi:imidazolonepropionase